MPNKNNTKAAGGYRDDMPRQPLRERPAFYERRDKTPLDNDIYLNPNMPKNTPIMRAPTRTERVGDMLRSAYDSVSEQPLVRIADMLGLSNIKGMADSFSDPNSGNKTAEMMGGPGNLAKLGLSRGVRPPGRYQGPMESPTMAAKSHPALPAEFNMEVRNPSRTAPIDMDNLPSGKMEYLDPDVAEYMNPSKLDVTSREGQRKLRFLTGK